jgi:hypothetical protein
MDQKGQAGPNPPRGRGQAVVCRCVCLAGFVALTLVLACSGKVTQAGGLELILVTDLATPRDFDAVHLTVRQQQSDGTWGTALVDSPFPVSADRPLPATFSIAAGHNPDQIALVDVAATKNGFTVVSREIQIQVPDDRVAALVVLLSSECLHTTCPAGQTCVPGEAMASCTSAGVDVSQLGPYVPGDVGKIDAGAAAANAVGGLDASSDEGGSGPLSTGEGGSKDGGSDGGSTGGMSCTGLSSQACGDCGTQTRACDHSTGTWSAWSACSGTGECAPNVTQSCGVGGTQTCSSSCTWGACVGQTCAGASSQNCGHCGVQTRTCDHSTGQWSPWSACGGLQGVCAPNAMQGCGTGGTQTCDATCQWGACMGGMTDAAADAPSTGGAPYGDPNLVSLFDGATLSGWIDSQAGGWSVLNGTIHGNGPAQGELYTQNDYGAFRLIFSVRHLASNPDHLPGVLFWGTRSMPIPFALAGIQFQPPNGLDWDYRPGVNSATGTNPQGVPEFSNPPARPSFDQLIWSQCEILALGDGTARMACCQPAASPNAPCKASEVVDLNNSTAFKSGPIGLQIHNAGTHDEYKDLYIETNPSSSLITTM